MSEDRCPKCGGVMVTRFIANGWMMFCQKTGCHYWVTEVEGGTFYGREALEAFTAKK